MEASGMNWIPVDKSFFDYPTLELAIKLIGYVLVKETEEGIAAGYIVETEAYMGPEDRAAHSYNNRRTKRTEIMFGEPGYAYTYVIHTHCLVNVVTSKVNEPHAILIRAVEPVYGLELMKKRRPNQPLYNLTSGPGKLTKALGITMEDYGHPLFEKPLYIAEGRKAREIVSGKRIGIEGSGEAQEYPWRFWEKGNPFVSKPR